MKDDLNILKVEYLINHWSDLPQIWNISSEEQTKIKNVWNEDNLQWNVVATINNVFATLVPSWNFSLVENLNKIILMKIKSLMTIRGKIYRKS